MKKIEHQQQDDIKLPEGLEARLLSKIDLWAHAEQQMRERDSSHHPYLNQGRRLTRYAAIAALAVVIVIVASMIFIPHRNPALTDTYDDSKVAYIKAVNALNMLSETLSMGKDKIDAMDLFITPTDTLSSPND